ncbi:hypothetical protein P9C14_15255, partial [Bacillus paralicheniformis]
MAKEKGAEQKSALNIIPLAVTILVGEVIWFIPSPAGLDPKAWHLF